MPELNTMEQLQQLVRQGFTDWRTLGDVYAKYHDGLVLFNYSPEAQYAGRWNWFEQVSRGLILDATTGEIVARPFDKFFNWGEGGRTTDAPLVNATEKMDGSLGIVYHWRGQWHVCTRGSLDSKQGQWATQWLRQHYRKLPIHEGCTLLVEIIYPENRVVVDYGDREELVLLAIRERHDGHYWEHISVENWAHYFGFARPYVYSAISEYDHVGDLLRMCATLDANKEGFVAEFADGQRFKFKGDAYKELHRLVCGLSFRNTVEAVANDKVDEVRAAIPDEFLGQFNAWVQEIEAKRTEIVDGVEMAYVGAPTTSRREFALWAQANHAPIAPYLFMRLDNRDYVPTIYKREFA